MSYTKKSLEMLDLDSNYSAISKAIPKGSGVEPSGSQQATPRNSGQRFTLASLTEQSNKVIGKIMSLSSLFDPKLEKCDGQDMDIVIVSPTTRNSKRMSTAFTAQQNDFQISTAKVSDYSLDPPSVDIHKMGLKSPKISSPLVSRGKSNSNDYDEAGEIRKSDSVESLASLPIMPHANSYAKKYGSRLLHKRPSTELSSICSLSPSKGHRKLVPAMIQTGCRRPSMFEKMNLRPSQDEIVSNLDKFFPDILNYEVCTPNPLRSPTNQVLIITKTESVISGQSSARSSAASHPKANPSPLSQATFFPDGAYASTSHEKLSTGTRTSRKQSIASATSSHHSRKQSLASDSSTPNSDGDRGAMAVGSPKISLIEVLRQEITKKKGRRTTVSMRMGQPRDSGMNSGVTPTSSMFFATSVVSKFPPILSLNLSVAEMPEEVVTYPAVQDGCASAVPNDNGATINDNGNEVDAKTSQIREQLITKAQQSIEDDADDKMVAWYKGDRIGRGAYGAVYLAINLKSWELMAVKQVENAVLNKLKIGSSGIITHEMEILESLNHPNIVAYKDNASIT